MCFIHTFLTCSLTLSHSCSHLIFRAMTNIPAHSMFHSHFILNLSNHFAQTIDRDANNSMEIAFCFLHDFNVCNNSSRRLPILCKYHNWTTRYFSPPLHRCSFIIDTVAVLMVEQSRFLSVYFHSLCG